MKITELRKHTNRLGEESVINLIKNLPKDKKLKILADIDPAEAYAIIYNSNLWLRPKQILPPGEWRNWLIMAGRGWGKGFAGAHAVIHWVSTHDNIRIALVGPTAAEVRDVMVMGPSGIMAWAPPHLNFKYNPSNRVITAGNNTIHTFSAEEPEQLRGPQFHKAWVDELAKMRYQREVWDMLSFCMRLGKRPQVVITTTPRPTSLMRELVKDDYSKGGGTKITSGSTYENEKNLSSSFIKAIKDKYEGTRLGQQEIYAKIIEDSPTALFKRATIDQNSVKEYPDLQRIVIAVDPAGSTKKNADETGIIVAGIDANDVVYVIGDYTGKYNPPQWTSLVISLYYKHQANGIVVERNYGGDLVRNALEQVDNEVYIDEVVATKGKAIRAEPVSVLLEKGQLKIYNELDLLKDEMCEFELSNKSPNRVDAMVWAVYNLKNLDNRGQAHAFGWTL